MILRLIASQENESVLTGRLANLTLLASSSLLGLRIKVGRDRWSRRVQPAGPAGPPYPKSPLGGQFGSWPTPETRGAFLSRGSVLTGRLPELTLLASLSASGPRPGGGLADRLGPGQLRKRREPSRQNCAVPLRSVGSSGSWRVPSCWPSVWPLPSPAPRRRRRRMPGAP